MTGWSAEDTLKGEACGRRGVVREKLLSTRRLSFCLPRKPINTILVKVPTFFTLLYLGI